jgi:hypothetical protein
VAPSTDILIGDPGADHVLICPRSRSHPSLFEYRDRNWIDCEVQVVAGGFRAGFQAALRSEEFRAFLEEIEGLCATLEGTASFVSMEGQLALSISGDVTGTLRVAGEAVDEAGAGNRLQFRFDVDGTCLQEISRSLEHLLTAFPVISTADA